MNKLSLHMEVLSKALFGKEPKDLNVKEAYNVVARTLMMDIQPTWRTEKKSNKKNVVIYQQNF